MSAPSRQKAAPRLAALDGLRGIASAIVVVSHFGMALWPALFFGDSVGAARTTLGYLASTPLFVFWSGTFAVFVFFVLSGYVIAASVADRTFSLPRMVVRRYVRLAVPVAIASLLAFVLAALPVERPQIAANTLRNPWLDQYWVGATPSLLSAGIESFISVFTNGRSWFNVVLWTMRIELWGSCAVYILYACLGRKQIVPVAFIATIVSIWSPQLHYFSAFPIGILIYEWHRSLSGSQTYLAFILICCGLYLGGQPYSDDPGPYYGWTVSIFPFSSFSAARTLGAALLVVGLLLAPSIRALLALRFPQFLGRISFALYLVHFPIMLTLVSFASPAHQESLWKGLALLASYLALAGTVAWLMTRAVDEPLLRILSGYRPGSTR
ncbi:MAG: acyltransferase family protein [Bosea sp. (in: a-proteobacteria)]